MSPILHSKGPASCHQFLANKFSACSALSPPLLLVLEVRLILCFLSHGDDASPADAPDTLAWHPLPKSEPLLPQMLCQVRLLFCSMFSARDCLLEYIPESSSEAGEELRPCLSSYPPLGLSSSHFPTTRSTVHAKHSNLHILTVCFLLFFLVFAQRLPISFPLFLAQHLWLLT